jgi:P4 family phage/plasmid primase-like protien
MHGPAPEPTLGLGPGTADSPEEEAQDEAREQKRTIRAARVLLEIVRETGKAALLFEFSACTTFASLFAIVDSGKLDSDEALAIVCEARVLADAHAATIGEKAGYWGRKVKAAAKAAAKKRYSLEDASLADAFIARFAGRIFRQKNSGSAYLWDADERAWRADDDVRPRVTAFLKQVAKTHPGEKEWLLSTRKHNDIFAAIRQSDRLPEKEVEFDAQKDLLGVPGGKVCELRKGIAGIRDRRPQDFVRMQTAVFPVVGETPIFDRFLADMFNEDAALVARCRRVFGYAATGSTVLGSAYVFGGSGDNGKSTLCRTVRKILGDYGYMSSAKAIAANYAGHDTVFAALDRKRFVEIPEVDRSLVLGARFKELTGGDGTTGRGMRENERQINIDAKFFICANNNIKFDGTSKSYKKRLETWPCRNNVAVPDRGLPDRLMSEAPAILAGIIEEAQKFLAGEALPASDTVADATKIYADEADRYAAFLGENDINVSAQELTEEKKQHLENAKHNKNIHPGCPGTSLLDIFSHWQRYAERHGETWVGPETLLAEALREKGYIVKPRSRPRNAFVVGLRTRTDADDKREAEAEAKAEADRARAAVDAAKAAADVVKVAAAEQEAVAAEREAVRVAALSPDEFQQEERGRRADREPF